MVVLAWPAVFASVFASVLASVLASVPTSQTPRAFNARMVRARLVTVRYGTVSAAPQATRRTVLFNPTARSRGAMTACAPAASALRRHAPRLCGSVTPSRISKCAGSLMTASTSSISKASWRALARATTPWWRTPRARPSKRSAGTGCTPTPAACACAISVCMRRSRRWACT